MKEMKAMGSGAVCILKTTPHKTFLIMLLLAASRCSSSFLARRPHTARLLQRQAISMSEDADSTIFHFNHAGASPSPSSVIERVVDHMYLEQRLGGYAAQAAVVDELDQVYKDTASLLHASSPTEIALVESSTVAWTRLFYSMVEHHDRIRKGEKVILMSEAEYAAQVVAISKWADEHDGWRVLVIPSALREDGSSTGMVDLDVFETMLQGHYKTRQGDTLDPSTIALVSVTHIPTNSGIANPVAEIGQLLLQKHSQAFYLVDACQSVGQMDVNVQEIRCHGLCGTGRKYLRAPRGSGFMFVDQVTASKLRPSHVDHECAPVVSVPSNFPDNDCGMVEYRYQEGAKRFEFWESSAASRLGFGEAVRYARELHENGMATIQQRILENSLELQRQLDSIEKVTLYYPGTISGIVTFATDMDPNQVKRQLWQRDSNGSQFAVSVVPKTSTPIDSARTKAPNLVRASISYMTTKEEIELFCARLKEVLA